LVYVARSDCLNKSGRARRVKIGGVINPCRPSTRPRRSDQRVEKILLCADIALAQPDLVGTVAVGTGGTVCASCTIRARVTLRPLRARRPLRAISAISAIRTISSGETLDTLNALWTLWTFRPFGTRNTLRPLRPVSTDQ
jgi:hypothetical protein